MRTHIHRYTHTNNLRTFWKAPFVLPVPALSLLLLAAAVWAKEGRRSSTSRESRAQEAEKLCLVAAVLLVVAISVMARSYVVS